MERRFLADRLTVSVPVTTWRAVRSSLRSTRDHAGERDQQGQTNESMASAHPPHVFTGDPTAGGNRRCACRNDHSC